MQPPRKVRNRLVFALLVGGAHSVVIWLAQNSEVPQPKAGGDEFAFTAFFDVPKTQPPTIGNPKPQRSKLSVKVEQSRRGPTLPVPPADDSTAITLPVTPPAIDWDQDVGEAADNVIAKAREDARRFDRFEDRPSREPRQEPKRDYAWYVRHSRQIIDAHGVPVWVLTQPCAVVILKTDPNCTVDHVEEHGVLFEYMQQEHDARLQYGGPNAVP